jgi:3-oxoacyl-[acyl-carrier-protein] synthase-3
MRAFIKCISYYLPEEVLTNEQLLTEFPEWSVEKVASKIGINQRHIAGANQTAGDMAEQAARKLLAEHNISTRDVDFILLCTQSPDYFLPTTACILQDKLGIPTTAGAIDFNLGCSGYVYGLSIAKGLIFSGTAQNVLLITSETYSKHLHPKDKSNRTIFGDGAAATLVSNEGFAEILNFSLGTDGRGAENLITKTGAFRFTKAKNDLHFDEEGNPVSSDHLYMNGTEIFNFTLENVPIIVEDTLKKNNLSMNGISLFIFHQANKYLMNFLRKKLRIKEEKFYYFIENVGNTVSSTIPIALKEAQNENKLHGNILLAGFGVGYSWGGLVLNCEIIKMT